MNYMFGVYSKHSGLSIKMSYIVLSDINGRLDRLNDALNDILKESPDEHQVVFLGNYIDKGDNSKECISMLMDFSFKWRNVKFLMGRSEELLLSLFDRIYIDYNSILFNETYEDIKGIWLRNGGDRTLESYKMKDEKFEEILYNIEHEHLSFFNKLEPLYIQKRIIFVSSGINKRIPLSENKISNFLWERPPFGFIYESQRLLVHGNTLCKTIKLNVTEMSLNINTGCYSDSGKLSVVYITENGQIEKIDEYK